MHMRRFGRKIALPATIAIKHQIRMRMPQDEAKHIEAEAAEVPCGPPGEEPLAK